MAALTAKGAVNAVKRACGVKPLAVLSRWMSTKDVEAEVQKPFVEYGPEKLGMIKQYLRNGWDEPKLGLLHDDYWYQTLEADEQYMGEEAVRRLPHDVNAARQFRLKRAMHYSGRKELLPKEEWISWEYDRQHGFYMRDIIDEVEAEMKEREMWDNRR